MSKVPDEADVQPVTVRLTSLEALMYKELSAMRLPFSVGVQQQIGPYVADFCVPMLRMDIEVDGQYWHNQPETKAHDQIRDKEMSQAGWTVLRFGEVEVKEQMPEVRKTILAYVNKNWRRAIEEQKRRAQALESSYGRLLKYAGEEIVEVPQVIDPTEVLSGDPDQGTGNPVG
jgi:very-short-patch-repair endonuclease